MFPSELPNLGRRARLLSGASAAVDQSALSLMERLWLLDEDPLVHLDAARRAFLQEMYAGADPTAFFRAPEAPRIEQTRSVRFAEGRRERWRWASAYRTWDPGYQAAYDRFAANRTAWAEALLHGDTGRTTLLCVHSWATGHFGLTRQVFGAGELFRAGHDVVIFMLPFHGPRTPRQAMFGGHLFPGTDPQRTNEGFGQAIWDLRALVSALIERGAGPIAAMGMSLGGYTAALLASTEPRLTATIPMIPLVSLPDLLWGHGRRSPRRARAIRQGITLEELRAVYAVHTPLMLTPLVPLERRLIVAGRGDRITSPDHVKALWEHWHRPAVHWFPGGHMTHFGHGRILRDVLTLLGECAGGAESEAAAG